MFLTRNYWGTNICPRRKASRANMLVLRTTNFHRAINYQSNSYRHCSSLNFLLYVLSRVFYISSQSKLKPRRKWRKKIQIPSNQNHDFSLCIIYEFEKKLSKQYKDKELLWLNFCLVWKVSTHSPLSQGSGN